MAKNSGGTKEVDSEFEAELLGDLESNGRRFEEMTDEELEAATSPAKPAMSLDEALKSNDPSARQVVADAAFKSQRKKTPPARPRYFLVDDLKEPIEAADKVEAMAKANDLVKKYPGPHGRRVREVRELEYAE